MTAVLPSTGWQARLALEFEHAGQRSILRRCRHFGPLRVQRPFYPEPDGSCQVYILHPPGGVVGGDRLDLDGQLGSNTRVLLTTPSAGKFYRSGGPFAQQLNTLTVQADAVLEWLPQETIVFDGAKLATTTRLELHANARALGWEILCLGRPSSAESFTRGVCQQSLEIYRDGQPLLLERSRWQGGSVALTAPWGLHAQPVSATLFCTLQDSTQVDALREQIQASPAARFAVTQVQDLLLCRYLGPSTAEARALFSQAWALLRPGLLHKPACPPRVWAL